MDEGEHRHERESDQWSWSGSASAYSFSSVSSSSDASGSPREQERIQPKFLTPEYIVRAAEEAEEQSRSVEVKVHNYNDNGFQVVDLDDDISLSLEGSGFYNSSSDSGSTSGVLSEQDVEAVEQALVGALDSYDYHDGDEYPSFECGPRPPVEGGHNAANFNSPASRDSVSAQGSPPGPGGPRPSAAIGVVRDATANYPTGAGAGSPPRGAHGGNMRPSGLLAPGAAAGGGAQVRSAHPVPKISNETASAGQGQSKTAGQGETLGDTKRAQNSFLVPGSGTCNQRAQNSFLVPGSGTCNQPPRDSFLMPASKGVDGETRKQNIDARIKMLKSGGKSNLEEYEKNKKRQSKDLACL